MECKFESESFITLWKKFTFYVWDHLKIIVKSEKSIELKCKEENW